MGYFYNKFQERFGTVSALQATAPVVNMGVGKKFLIENVSNFSKMEFLIFL